MARQFSGVILSADILKEAEKTLLVFPNEDEDDQHVFDAKIDILQKVLRNSMSRFSIGRLHTILQTLVRLVNMQESSSTSASPEQTARQTPTNIRITSTGQMRTILKSLDEYNKRSGLSTNQTKVVKFLRNFLTDVSSIKKIKEQFDKGVFEYLKTMHSDLDRQETAVSRSVKGNGRSERKTSAFNENDSGNYSQTELDEQETSSKVIKEQQSYSQLGFSSAIHIDGNMNEKLKITVKELENVSNRWSRLLQDDNLDINDFDPESHHEIAHLRGYSEFELIFRLFPDMFAKCYKCIELSKQWWGLVNQNRKDSAQRKNDETSENAAKIILEPRGYFSSNHIETRSPSIESVDSQVKVDTPSLLCGIARPERDDTDANNNITCSDTTFNGEVNYTTTYTDLSVNSDAYFSARKTPNHSIDNKESPTTIKQPITNEETTVIPRKGSNNDSKTSTPEQLDESAIPKTDIFQLNVISADNKILTSQTFTKLPQGNKRKQLRLININTLIMECESQWQSYHDENVIIQSRENKILTMSGMWGKLGQNLTEVTRKYKKLKEQRKEMAQMFSYTIRGTSKYFDLREKVRKCEVKLRQYDQTLRLLRYQQAVIGQDYMLEMELRPNFIRVSGHLQQCMKEMVHRLTELKFEKYSIERDLGLTQDISFQPSTVTNETTTNVVLADESVFTPDFKIYDTSLLFDHMLPNSGNSSRQSSLLSHVPQTATEIKDVPSTNSCKTVDTQTETVSPRKQEGKRLSSASKTNVSNKDQGNTMSPRANDSSSTARTISPKDLRDTMSPHSKEIMSPTPKSKHVTYKYPGDTKIPRAKASDVLNKRPEITTSPYAKNSTSKKASSHKTPSDTTKHRDRDSVSNVNDGSLKEPGSIMLPRTKASPSKASDALNTSPRETIIPRAKDINSKIKDVSKNGKGHTVSPHAKDSSSKKKNASHKGQGDEVLPHAKVTKDRLTTVTRDKGQGQLTKPKANVNVNQKQTYKQ